MPQLTDPEGRVFGYRYDAAGQVAAFVDPDGSESRLTYDAAGRLTEVAYPNGVTETRAYDAAGGLAKLAVQGPEGPLESYTYARDARGFATEQVEEDGATTTWAYDAAGRLVRVDYPAGKIQSIRDQQGATVVRVKPALVDGDPDAQETTGATGLGTRLADLVPARSFSPPVGARPMAKAMARGTRVVAVTVLPRAAAAAPATATVKAKAATATAAPPMSTPTPA